MKILGVKLTHDACISLVDGDRLIRHIEMEKLGNRSRYTKMNNVQDLMEACEHIGVNWYADEFELVIDGWKGAHIEPWALNVAPYSEFEGGSRSPFKAEQGVFLGRPFVSYQHVTGHVVGAYAMSPFAAAKEPAQVLCWDGGMEPRVFSVNKYGEMRYKDSLWGYYGFIYSVMGYYFGPYRKMVNGDGMDQKGEYDWPGKLMSFIGRGVIDKNLDAEVQRLFVEHSYPRWKRNFLDFRGHDAVPEHNFCKMVRMYCDQRGIDDATAALAIHNCIERGMVQGLKQICAEGTNLIFTGGSALNIKWNSAIRESGHFADVFVPPCPNDCGSSIGAAATHNVVRNKRTSLDWNVFCGPNIDITQHRVGWQPVRYCSAQQLAEQLQLNNLWPIVVLRGRAEIGPRALGMRSIIAPADAPGAQALLNKVKRREEFRPVSPIVLEEQCAEWFNPGVRDPYMLFDHEAKPNTKRFAAEIVHIDGTSRVQTVSKKSDPWMHELITHLSTQLMGPPMICNTSANHNGKGFFHSLLEAQSWAEDYNVPAVFCEDTLWLNPNASIKKAK